MGRPADVGCLLCMQPCALWYNMREEVVVYINGQPFVLREDGRPFKNMEVGLPCASPEVARLQATSGLHGSHRAGRALPLPQVPEMPA